MSARHGYKCRGLGACIYISTMDTNCKHDKPLMVGRLDMLHIFPMGNAIFEIYFYVKKLTSSFSCCDTYYLSGYDMCYSHIFFSFSSNNVLFEVFFFLLFLLKKSRTLYGLSL